MTPNTVLTFFTLVALTNFEGSAVLIENPFEQNLENAITEAENFAVQNGVRPEALLILLTSIFHNEKLNLNANLLVSTPSAPSVHDENLLVLSLYDMVPLYFDVLATNLKVVVISAPFLPFLEPFEIFRHNLLLHVILGGNDMKLSYVSINTLFWFADGSRGFACVNSFDDVIALEVNAFMKACSTLHQRTVCSMEKLLFRRTGSIDREQVAMHALFICNGTAAPVKFDLTKAAVFNYQQCMLNRFALSATLSAQCGAYIMWRDTDVAALIKPFNLGTWMLTFMSILVIARVVSWSNMSDFKTMAIKISMNLITAVDVDVSRRKLSQTISAGSALALCFFLTQIYTNFIMLTFLDPRVPNPCHSLFQCRHFTSCYSRYRLEYDLSAGHCLCGMNHIQRSLVGKPLSRTPRRWEPLHAGTKIADRRPLYMQTSREIKQPMERGQLLLNPVRVSSIIARLLETAVVAEERSEPKYQEVRAYLRRPAASMLRRLSNRNAKRRTGLIDFNSTIGEFDMSHFRKVAAVFEVCAISCVFLLSCEFIRRQRHRSRNCFSNLSKLSLYGGVRRIRELIHRSVRFIRQGQQPRVLTLCADRAVGRIGATLIVKSGTWI